MGFHDETAQEYASPHTVPLYEENARLRKQLEELKADNTWLRRVITDMWKCPLGVDDAATRLDTNPKP